MDVESVQSHWGKGPFFWTGEGWQEGPGRGQASLQHVGRRVIGHVGTVGHGCGAGWGRADMVGSVKTVT